MKNHKPSILLDLLPYGSHDGGFSSSVKKLLEICKHLSEFDFTLLIHARHAAFFQSYGYKVIVSTVAEKLKFFASSWVVQSVVRSQKFDLVYGEISHAPYFCSAPVAIKVHDLCWLRSNYPAPNSLKELIYRQTYLKLYVSSLRHATLLGSISKSTAQDIVKYSKYRGPIEILNPAFEPTKTVGEDKSYPSPSETVNLLYVGNLHPRKNVPFLLRAMPNIRCKWKLDIIGNFWSDAKKVQRLAAADPRIAIRGYVDDATLAEFYRSAHLLILPSLCEGFGFPVIEAAHSHCLPLASRGSCFEEILPEPCLFSLDDPIYLSHAIDAVNAHNYATLVKRVKERAAAFSFEQSIADYHRFFLKAIKLGRQRVSSFASTL